MDFHVGQKVVCVNAQGLGPRVGYGDESHPVEGQVYTVRALAVTLLGRRGLLLEEIVNPARAYGPLNDAPIEPAFVAYRFRPLQTTNIDVFLKMLEPAPKELQPAE